MWLLTLLFGSAYGRAFGPGADKGGDFSFLWKLLSFDWLGDFLFGTGSASAPTSTTNPSNDVTSWTTAYIASLTPADVVNLPLTTDQIAALSTDQIRAFSTATIAALGPGLLQAITTTNAAALTTDQIVALTTAQFQVLPIATIDALTSAQVRAIELVDLQALTTQQIGGLTTGITGALTTAQVVALTTSQIPALSTASIAAFSTTQAVAIEPIDIAVLTTAQIVVLPTETLQQLGPAQVAAITTTQFAAMTTAQQSVLSANITPLTPTSTIAALTPVQIANLTTNQIANLTTVQVAALSTLALATLSTVQIMAIETADIVALTTSQILAFATNQIGVLTTSQAQAFTTNQVDAFTPDQIPGFTTAAVAVLDLFGSPIILDLNGDGVRTLGIEAGVKFDLFADGTAINAGWVSSGDGLLVLDRNHDGSINDGTELFGTATKLANGQSAPDGYAALRELDANQDGVISSADAVYQDLRIWVDANSDGVTETGELKSLQSLDIAKINLTAMVGTQIDNGNILGLTSTYETTDGAVHDAADVWFRADKTGGVTAPNPATLTSVDSAIAALNTNNAPPLLAPTDQQQTTVPVLTATSSPAPITLEALAPSDGLRMKVSELAQAISGFSQADVQPASSNTVQLNMSGGTEANNTPSTLVVASMVDMLKQFDANGNPIAAPSTAIATQTTALTVPKLQDGISGGILSSSGGTVTQ